MHSFKGLCGMMGLPQVQTLAHRFEGVLDDLRHGTIEPDRSLSEKLLEVVEALSILLASSAKGSSSNEELEQVGRLLDGLDTLPRLGVTEPGSRLHSLFLRPSERALLSTYEESRLVENLREGKSIYQIIVRFNVSELDQRFKSLSSALSKSGELITTLPVADQQQDGIGLKLIYASELEAAALELLIVDYSGSVAGSLAKIGGPQASGEPPDTPQPRKRKRKETGETAAARGANKNQAAGRQPPEPAVADQQTFFAVLPPEVAQEALQPLSDSVSVEMSEIDEISGLAHELSIEAQRLSDMA
ncbi:MAG: Hpt domain-containing protein, partial [Blastocatellia bacterium]